MLAVPTAPTEATADGERSPMIGAAVIGARASEHDVELFGVELEAAWWWGRLGLAAHGSLRWGIDADRPRVGVVGGSARVQVFDGLMPSLLEPRDVELGLEAHAIVEQVWWARDASVGHGLGLAVRLRGGGDDPTSPLLAESRLFLRVMSSRWTPVDAVARTMTPPDAEPARELTVLFGIGAAFGAGEPRYVQRFHAQPLDLLR